MSQDEEILRNLYNNFDPFRPLPAGDPLYVDCREVRGDGDILVELGKNIRRTNRITCQLYSGHRGAGKSTELLRLKQYLESQKFFVVYFAADEQDVNPQDTQYTDILLACTRHLLEDLKDSANPSPVLNWLKSRWVELKDLALTEISFESLSIESQISQFAKLTANLRAVPTLRQQIRNQVNLATVMSKLGCQKLIKIVDKFLKLIGFTGIDSSSPNAVTDWRMTSDRILYQVRLHWLRKARAKHSDTKPCIYCKNYRPNASPLQNMQNRFYRTRYDIFMRQLFLQSFAIAQLSLRLRRGTFLHEICTYRTTGKGDEWTICGSNHPQLESWNRY